MRYMIDTNTCIFLMSQMQDVWEHFKLKRHSGVVISSITLAELEYGVSKSSMRYKSENRSRLSAFLNLIDVTPFEENATSTYGELRFNLQIKGNLIGTMDMLIAAHAKSNGLILVTDNTNEFERVEGLILENWRR